MSLRNPRIGPILGYTTTSSARFMAGIQYGPSATKVNCGWLRIRKLGEQWQQPKRFRFNKNFFYTGVIEIDGLDVSCRYEYQVAFESTYSEKQLSGTESWNEVSVHQFRTNSTDLARFCFGSCMRGGDDDRVGKVLKNIEKFNDEKPVDFMLWLGDQVYNDKLLALTPNNWSTSDFSDLYEGFFKNKYASKVLPRTPNYMLIDDHEIANGFTDGMDEYLDTNFNWLNHNKERLINGMRAFYAYQASHGPLFDTSPSEQDNVKFVKGQNGNQVPTKNYSELNMGEIGVFLMDTRKERSHGELISKVQERHLLEFLKRKYRIKFVASSVTFLADNRSKKVKSDNWKRAAKQRKRILNFIDRNSINNVFFLSGDVHSHFAAQLHKDGKPKSVYQLVSGSLFWPTSFLINRVRWFEEDVRFSRSIYGAPDFKLSAPLSDTSECFYAGNAIGLVDISPHSVNFRVVDCGGHSVFSSEMKVI